MSLHLWSSAAYAIPLPDGHRFPMSKYALLRDGVLREGLVAPENLHAPERAPLNDLLLVHDAAYVNDILHGTLPAAAQRRIGLPWSELFVERAFRVVRGTCEAAEAALVHGISRVEHITRFQALVKAFARSMMLRWPFDDCSK